MKKLAVLFIILFSTITFAQEKHTTEELYLKVLNNIGENAATYFSQNVKSTSIWVENFYNTDHTAFISLRNALNRGAEIKNSGETTSDDQLIQVINKTAKGNKNSYQKGLNDFTSKEVSSVLQFYRAYLQSSFLENDPNYNVENRDKYLLVLTKMAEKKFGKRI